MAELMRVDMVSADLFCRRDQGLLDVDRGDHDGTRLAVIRPNNSFPGMTTMALEPLMAAAKTVEESGKAGSHRYDPELFRFGLVYIQSAPDSQIKAIYILTRVARGKMDTSKVFTAVSVTNV